MPDCSRCRYYVRRELTPLELQFLKWNPDKMINNVMCGIGGCDGSMYEQREADMRGEEQ